MHKAVPRNIDVGRVAGVKRRQPRHVERYAVIELGGHGKLLVE